jgi:hypothetical protein
LILAPREDVKQLRFEVKDGFIELKQALKDQGAEIKQLIEQRNLGRPVSANLH